MPVPQSLQQGTAPVHSATVRLLVLAAASRSMWSEPMPAIRTRCSFSARFSLSLFMYAVHKEALAHSETERLETLVKQGAHQGGTALLSSSQLLGSAFPALQTQAP